MLSGLQIALVSARQRQCAIGVTTFSVSVKRLMKGEPMNRTSAYITKQDEEGRHGFVAADLEDERTLILENRNVSDQGELPVPCAGAVW